MTAATTLNPFAAYDPVVSLRQNAFYGRIWKIAELISYIAFPVLGIFAGTFMLVSWPIHLKIVIILSSLVGIFGLYKLQKISASKGDRYEINGCKDKDIKKIAKELAKKNLNHILETDLGFSSTASDSMKKNLLACYFYHERSAEKFKKVAQYVKQPNTLNRTLSLATTRRLKAAYYLHLIQNPKDIRKIKDFVRIKRKMQLIDKATGKVFSPDQILSTSAPRLSSQIFGLQRNQSFFKFW